MKAFVTFIRTLFNSQATSAGGRALRRPFSLLVRRHGLVRALLTLLAALLLGTGLSVLQACNSQPQPAAQPEVRTSGQAAGQAAEQAAGQAAGQAVDRAASRTSERVSERAAQDRASERASDRASGGVADWTRDRASERANDRNPDRASGRGDRASDRSSDRASRQGGDGMGTVAVADLPDEARRTLALIREGGPYPYEKDGTVFGNYERKLPRQRRGYYTEYTVRTPQIRSRGARRIIAGGRDGRPTEFYYTDDHYQTFRRIEFP